MGDDKKIKSEIMYYSKLLECKGLLSALEGNVSVLDRDSGLLYITPTGTRKSFLESDMIAIMSDDKQVGGTRKRSSEYVLHMEALKVRKDCNAVVHSHAPYLTAFALCNQPISIRCSVTFGLLFEDIPCLPYGQPGTPDIAVGIGDAIKNHDLILLGNHGALSVGKTLEDAVAIMEAAEETLHTYCIARAVGAPKDIVSANWEKMCNEHPSSCRNRHK